MAPHHPLLHLPALCNPHVICAYCAAAAHPVTKACLPPYAICNSCCKQCIRIHMLHMHSVLIHNLSKSRMYIQAFKKNIGYYENISNHSIHNCSFNCRCQAQTNPNNFLYFHNRLFRLPKSSGCTPTGNCSLILCPPP